MGILEDAIREHLELKRKHGADPTEVAKQEREALSPATREAAGGGDAVGLAEPEAAEADFADAGFADPALAPGEPGAPELGGPPSAGFFDFESEAEATQVAPPPVEEPLAAAEEPIAGGPHEDDLFADTAEEYVRDSHPPVGAAPAEAEAPAPTTPDEPDGPGDTSAFDAEELFAEEDAVERAAPPAAPAPPPAAAGAAPPPAPARPAAAEEEADDEAGPPTGAEDVLEQTPDFLEETPDHDRLWFEQKPPRDFDF